MKYSKKFTTLASIMLAMLPLGAAAEDGDKNLSEFTFAKTLFGENPTDKYLDGKVVILEYWGVN